MIRLRQSTASQEVPIGRFLDSADGDTEETGLTIANTDVKLWKSGATALVNKNSGGATHMAGGLYYIVLDATDTDTVGPLRIDIHVAGALAVTVWAEVLAAAVYDWWYGTTAPSTYAGADTSGTTTLLSRLTALRAGYLDNLSAPVASATDLATLDGKADAIQAKTDLLPSDPADESLLEAAIATRAAPGDAMALTSGERTSLGAALGSRQVGPVAAATADRVLLSILAALLAKTSGGGTDSIVLRNLADSANLATVAVDENDNRTTVTLTWENA